MTITKLPVLNAVFKATVPTIPNIQKIVFVCVQHLLDTTLELFKALIALGAAPHNIFVIGKQYSTCESIADEIQHLNIQLQKSTTLTALGEYEPVFKSDISTMWQRVERHVHQHMADAIIVLDDGGRCLECIVPGMLNELPIIGIEQTTAGLFNPIVMNLHVPFVDVATSAAKIHLESGLVAETVLKKLTDVLPMEKQGLSCGVVGVGAVGKSVTTELISLGCKVYTYDKNQDCCKNMKKTINCNSLEDLMHQSDYVFGCTGRDITVEIPLNLITDDKVFISCSSEDKEFLTLLKLIQTENNPKLFNPLQDIQWKLPNGATIHLLRGGFPITFDNSGTGAPANKIQLTSGLLFSALVQAITHISYLKDVNIKGRTMLHPQAQKFVAKAWFKANQDSPFSTQLMDDFNNIDWIAINSGGLSCESRYMKTCFSDVLIAKSGIG